LSKCSFLWQIYKMLGKIYNNPKSGRLVSFYIHCSDWYMYSKPLLWLRTVYLISFILIKIGLQLSNSSRSTIMKRKFKQWWPTIAPIFTKRIITSHLILQLEFWKKTFIFANFVSVCRCYFWRFINNASYILHIIRISLTWTCKRGDKRATVTRPSV
jgi:hypothetical protein